MSNNVFIAVTVPLKKKLFFNAGSVSMFVQPAGGPGFGGQQGGWGGGQQGGWGGGQQGGWGGGQQGGWGGSGW